jgi:hypothetical protein
MGQLKIDASRITEARSTGSEEIRNENVTAKGRPAAVKPMNSGMDEQEQNGVSVPRRAASVLAPIPVRPPGMARVRSGGKWLWT